jgi:hypothetical protein
MAEIADNADGILPGIGLSVRPAANAGVPADSFQKQPTHSKNGHLWKQLADSGNSWPTLAIRTVCGFLME